MYVFQLQHAYHKPECHISVRLQLLLIYSFGRCFCLVLYDAHLSMVNLRQSRRPMAFIIRWIMFIKKTHTPICKPSKHIGYGYVAIRFTSDFVIKETHYDSLLKIRYIAIWTKLNVQTCAGLEHNSSHRALPTPESTSHNHSTLPQSFSSLDAWLQAHLNNLLHHTEISLSLLFCSTFSLTHSFPVSLFRNSWQSEREVKNPRQCAREISECLFFPLVTQAKDGPSPNPTALSDKLK